MTREPKPLKNSYLLLECLLVPTSYLCGIKVTIFYAATSIEFIFSSLASLITEGGGKPIPTRGMGGIVALTLVLMTRNPHTVEAGMS